MNVSSMIKADSENTSSPALIHLKKREDPSIGGRPYHREIYQAFAERINQYQFIDKAQPFYILLSARTKKFDSISAYLEPINQAIFHKFKSNYTVLVCVGFPKEFCNVNYAAVMNYEVKGPSDTTWIVPSWNLQFRNQHEIQYEIIKARKAIYDIIKRTKLGIFPGQKIELLNLAGKVAKKVHKSHKKSKAEIEEWAKRLASDVADSAD